MTKDAKKNITFGIMLGPSTPWENTQLQAKLVEQLGFDKLWVPDHFVNPEFIEMDWFDCWLSLTALIPSTKTISLGTLVSSMAIRNPVVLAKMAITLDHISKGRFELGVGSGGVVACHEMTGITNWSPSERSKRYIEFVEILNSLLNNKETSYTGDFNQLNRTLMHPQPFTKPHPILSIAAHGPRALKLAAKYGDSWNTLSPGVNLAPEQHSDNTYDRCMKMSEFADQAGRDPNDIGRTMLFGWTSDRLFDSIDQFNETINRYIKAGINDFCFIYAPNLKVFKGQAITTEEYLFKLSEEALPKLRMM